MRGVQRKNAVRDQISRRDIQNSGACVHAYTREDKRVGPVWEQTRARRVTARRLLLYKARFNAVSMYVAAFVIEVCGACGFERDIVF